MLPMQINRIAGFFNSFKALRAFARPCKVKVRAYPLVQNSRAYTRKAESHAFAFALVVLAGSAQADTLILPGQGVLHEGILKSFDMQGSQALIRFTSVESFPHTSGPSLSQRGTIGASVVLLNSDTGVQVYSGCTLTAVSYLESAGTLLTVSCP